jgi:hypothetical protein
LKSESGRTQTTRQLPSLETMAAGQGMDAITIAKPCQPEVRRDDDDLLT